MLNIESLYFVDILTYKPTYNLNSHTPTHLHITTCTQTCIDTLVVTQFIPELYRPLYTPHVPLHLTHVHTCIYLPIDLHLY